MANFYTQLDDNLSNFISRQHMFFVASAPAHGRINLSPKGLDTFRVICPTRVAYLDLTGSGNETAAHVKENGRMTVMFCSFEKQPLILRIYGKGSSIRPECKAWKEYAHHFSSMPGQRQIILIEIESIQTSCGFSVPIYSFSAERETLHAWANKKGEVGIKKYWIKKNSHSIDGLPTGIVDD